MPQTERRENWQGSKWCRRSTRLAIYLRDGLACVYCGTTIEDGAVFGLDHIRPVSKGGTNKSRNLVTACRTCNSSRGNRSVRKFVEALAHYLNENATEKTVGGIIAHIKKCRRRKLPREEARKLLARRKTVKAACEKRVKI